ncbi:uncharacterized protein ColSpa_06537 [Colletotrichum spaethianum]|uniref:Rhodopsin domain-containing protein n=1 Tax=Colletotrichum spaethianum TaxID=700344 RepID=A0AA37P6G5_9PEZI|nr:uncharacterized protein ColSpa_06537 [Colletotrichum spaethianum]GKT46356.1 hypothetical protein ColSpa_06537 [Colletotrichum spaethianum]
MLFSERACQVILVFSTGIFVIITGCIRLVKMKTMMFLTDPTFNVTIIGIWIDLEGHVGLWVASSPALQPLVRFVSQKLGFRSKLHSYVNNGQSNPCGSSGKKPTPGVWAGATRNKAQVQNLTSIDITECRSECSFGPEEDEEIEMYEMSRGARGFTSRLTLKSGFIRHRRTRVARQLAPEGTLRDGRKCKTRCGYIITSLLPWACLMITLPSIRGE